MSHKPTRRDEEVHPADGTADIPGTGEVQTAPRFSGLWPLAMILAFQCVFLVAIYSAAVSYAPPVRMSVTNAVAPPRGTVSLELELSRDWPRLLSSGLSGIEVVLESGDGAGAGGAVVASSRTDANGVASFSVTAPEKPGLLRYRASVKDPGKLPLAAPSSEILLDVVPEGGSCLLVSVPSTLEAELLKGPEVGADGSRKLSPAAEVLADLGRRHTLLYFAGAESGNLRARLDSRGFPEAPVVGARPTTRDRPFRDEVKGLDLSRWKGNHWAITKDSGQAIDFAFCGIRTIVLGAAPGPEVDGHRILSAASWNEVKKILERAP